MSFCLDFKFFLIAVLFLVGLVGCVHVTKKAKLEHRLSETQLGIYPNYTVKDFQELITRAPATATSRADRYVWPILFPYDLLLLICVGGFASFASLALAGAARVPIEIVPLLVLVPVLYMVSDLTENSVVSWLLMRSSAASVTESGVDVARAATIAKLYLLGLGGSQLLGLAVAATYFCIRGRMGS